MPRLPVVNPTTVFKAVMTMAARTELPAAARFSARIDSAEEMAGLADMLALSPLGAGCAKANSRRALKLLLGSIVVQS
jgi:hypothetical protein